MSGSQTNLVSDYNSNTAAAGGGGKIQTFGANARNCVPYGVSELAP